MSKKKEQEKIYQVAVITPYRPQIFNLRRAIKVEDYPNFQIDINTVDAFQGKDADIVIFGITRTDGTQRFFSDSRRLNVALSRAKNKLWIVGNKHYTNKHQLLYRIATKINEVKFIPDKNLQIF